MMNIPSLPAWIYSPDGESLILEREEAIAYYLGEGWAFHQNVTPESVEDVVEKPVVKRGRKPRNG